MEFVFGNDVALSVLVRRNFHQMIIDKTLVGNRWIGTEMQLIKRVEGPRKENNANLKRDGHNGELSRYKRS